jgi:hypothetical protein
MYRRDKRDKLEQTETQNFLFGRGKRKKGDFILFARDLLRRKKQTNKAIIPYIVNLDSGEPFCKQQGNV